VFLDPIHKEEYALARYEKKVDKGYSGFTFDANKNITLKQDLIRRDFTINALVKDVDNNIIDLVGGLNDLKQKTLRHISKNFIEDPLRVIRLARFSAKLPDFTIAPETIELCVQIAKNNELEYLTKERVWLELFKTLKLSKIENFFKVLNQTTALQVVLPEFTQILDLSTKEFAMINAISNEKFKFAILCSYLKLENLQKLIKRLPIPNTYANLALKINEFYETIKNPPNEIEKIFDIAHKLQCFRKNSIFNEIISCLKTSTNIKSLQWWQKLHLGILAIKPTSIKLSNKEIGSYIKKQRMNFIKSHLVTNIPFKT